MPISTSLRDDLVVDAFIYPTARTGRTRPVPTGYPCPCKPDPDVPIVTDCRFNFDGAPIQPGETRRVGLVLLNPALGLPFLRKAGKFYFWELGIFGEATIVE